MLLMLAAGAIVVTLDQLSKAMVVARLPEGAVTAPGLLGVRLRHVANRRNPWRSRRAVLVMGIVWLLATAAAVFAATLVDAPLARIALGGLVGGATGNLLDALSHSAVTDFIDLRIWPVFNIADAAIVASAVILMWSVVRIS